MVHFSHVFVQDRGGNTQVDNLRKNLLKSKSSATNSLRDEQQLRVGEDAICTYLPPGAERLFEAEIEKPVKGQTDTWIPRLAVVSKDRVSFSRPGSRLVNETIWLQDILRIDTQGLSEANLIEGSESAQRPGSSGSKPQTQKSKSRIFSTQSSNASSELSSADLHAQLRDTLHSQKRTLVFVMQNQSKLLMRAQDRGQRDQLIKQVKEAKKRLMAGEGAVAFAWKIRALHDSTVYQCLMYSVIGWGFVLSLYETQMLPHAESAASAVLYWMELLITIIFSIDLLIHFLGWVIPNKLLESLHDLFLDPWVMFDLCIVVVSWISLFSASVPGLSSMRLLRVFRVVKLLRNWPALRNMIGAISRSVETMVYNFAVVLTITSVFAVLSTHMFRERSPVYFGDWGTSMYTMMQLSTGHGWPEVSRECWKDPEIFDPWVGWYFLSYVIAVTTILMNVVVAALLDEYLASRAKDKEEYAQEVMQDFLNHSPELTGPLDALMSSLSLFATPEDLSRRISEIFEVFDPDSTGCIGFDMMAQGLRTLRLGESVHFSQEDWYLFTGQGQHLTENHHLSFQAFNFLVREELRRYSYRMLSQAMNNMDERAATSLLSLKLLLSAQGCCQIDSECRATSAQKWDDNQQSQTRPQSTDPQCLKSPASAVGTELVFSNSKKPTTPRGQRTSTEVVGELPFAPSSGDSGKNSPRVSRQPKAQTFTEPRLVGTSSGETADMSAKISALDKHLSSKFSALDSRMESFQQRIEAQMGAIFRKLDASVETMTQVVQIDNELISSAMLSRTNSRAEV